VRRTRGPRAAGGVRPRQGDRPRERRTPSVAGARARASRC
jgi:hypothetical protein